jgi:hypothetical protein
MHRTAICPSRVTIAALAFLASCTPAAAQIGPRVPVPEAPAVESEPAPITYLAAELLGTTFTMVSGNGNQARVVFGPAENNPAFPVEMNARGGRLQNGIGSALRPSADGTMLVAARNADTVRRDPSSPNCISMTILGTGYLACPRRDEAQPEWSKLLAGEWTTASGTLTFEAEGRLLRGTVRRPDSNGVPVVVRRFAIWGWYKSNTIRGAWAYPENDRGGEVTIELAADGKSFTGTMARTNQPPETWTGRRKDAPARPSAGGASGGGTTSTPPASGPGSTGSGGGSQPGSGSPTAPAGFDSLRRYDVRLDGVVRASDEARVDVFVTLRNATQGILHSTSSALKVRLEDDEGVGKEASQAFRATPEGRVHFASTPVIEPGGQLKVKFTFFAGEGGVPAKVAIIEGDKRVSYDLDF